MKIINISGTRMLTNHIMFYEEERHNQVRICFTGGKTLLMCVSNSQEVMAYIDKALATQEGA